MFAELNSYAEHIVCYYLGLKKNEVLIISCEESAFSFAKLVSGYAQKVTDSIVKILISSNGKVVDSIEFEPEKPNPTVIGNVFLRINHEKKNEKFSGILKSDDYSSFQRAGHLAPPIVLGRRISLPNCCVPFYDPDDERWRDVEKFLSHDFSSFGLSVDYRTQFLNHADIDALHFFCDDCDFTIDVPEYTSFVSPRMHLSNGRKYISDFFYDRISFSVAKKSANGRVHGSALIKGVPEKLDLEYKNGKLVSNNCSSDIFTVNESICLPGYISFRDKEFLLYLGGSDTSLLINPPEKEEDLPEDFNSCPFSVCVRLPENVNVSYIDCSEKENELVRRGFFLE